MDALNDNLQIYLFALSYSQFIGKLYINIRLCSNNKRVYFTNTPAAITINYYCLLKSSILSCFTGRRFRLKFRSVAPIFITSSINIQIFIINGIPFDIIVLINPVDIRFIRAGNSRSIRVKAKVTNKVYVTSTYFNPFSEQCTIIFTFPVVVFIIRARSAKCSDK